ncbi:hypothetical protein VP150E351_P0102 [Vibrio phage 150E35-1]|nr:hypothetical protein VP150E351_P0102 [Vibrio phage 150E35-1]
MSKHTYFDVLRITTNTGDITSIAHRNITCMEYVPSEGNMYVRFGEGAGCVRKFKASVDSFISLEEKHATWRAAMGTLSTSGQFLPDIEKQLNDEITRKLDEGMSSTFNQLEVFINRLGTRGTELSKLADEFTKVFGEEAPRES